MFRCLFFFHTHCTFFVYLRNIFFMHCAVKTRVTCDDAGSFHGAAQCVDGRTAQLTERSVPRSHSSSFVFGASAEGISWAHLREKLASVSLSEAQDRVSSKLLASGQFSVKSLYSKLTQGPALDIARGLWKAGLPLKIKIFLWQMFRNRLPTSDNVAKRQGPSNGTCTLCGNAEDANHVFFRCHLARFVWSAVREAFSQSWNPSSGADLLNILKAHRGSFRRVLWRCVGALLWSLWSIRNKLTIEKKFPSHPADCIFKCHLFLQQWTPLGKRQDTEFMREAMEKIRNIQVIARHPPAPG